MTLQIVIEGNFKSWAETSSIFVTWGEDSQNITRGAHWKYLSVTINCHQHLYILTFSLEYQIIHTWSTKSAQDPRKAKVQMSVLKIDWSLAMDARIVWTKIKLGSGPGPSRNAGPEIHVLDKHVIKPVHCHPRRKIVNCHFCTS